MTLISIYLACCWCLLSGIGVATVIRLRRELRTIAPNLWDSPLALSRLPTYLWTMPLFGVFFLFQPSTVYRAVFDDIRTHATLSASERIKLFAWYREKVDV